MFKKNVGGIDRVLRISVGVAILAWGLVVGSPLALIGLVPLATGGFGICPAYSIFGFSTCPIKNSNP